MVKKVHTVRHGEVDNPTGILYGRLPDFHLSAAGRAQAELVAQWFEGKNIGYLGVSPMERAQETAVPLVKALSLTPVTDVNLIEGSSLFEGKKVAFGDGALSRPWHWWKLRNPFRPSWGEPYLQVAQRMELAVAQALDNVEEGQEAVLISHQLPLWILRLHYSGKHLWHNPARRECALASVTSYTFEGTALQSIDYAEPAGASDPTITGA